MHVGSRARFEQAYQDIAERLELPGHDDPRSDVLKLVSDWLCNDTNGEWVMVLDDVHTTDIFSHGSDESQDREIMPLSAYVPQSRNGSVLITSRNKDASYRLVGTYGRIKEVCPMGEREGLQLLRTKLGDAFTEDKTRELLDALGCMPIAINQAAAYINHRTHMTVATYLEELLENQKKKESLLNWDSGDLRRDKSASSSVLAIFQMSFDRIRQEKPSAAALLSLMSYFNRQGIPEPVLRRTIGNKLERDGQDDTNDEFDADIDLLQAYSLITVTTGTGLCNMHALVQFCMQLWLSSSGEAKKWECIFVNQMVVEFPVPTYENSSDCQLLLPHAETLFESEPTDDTAIRPWGQLLVNVAYYLRMRGIYRSAQKVATKALKAQERILGHENEATIATVNILAVLLQAQAHFSESEVLHQRVLATRQQTLRKDHPLILESINNLAVLFQDEGKYDKAEKLYRQALKSRRRILGEHHLDTLLSMNCLAAALQGRARYEEGVDSKDERLEEVARDSDEDYHDMKSTVSLSRQRKTQMQRHEAETLYRQCLEGRKTALGDQHPQTLMTMSNLACTLMDQGKFSEAEVLNRQVLEGRQILGEQHPDTLTSVSNLAQVLQAQERYAEAEVLNRQALEGRKEQLGDQHPDTLTSVNNLAINLADIKHYKEAAEYFKVALIGLEQSLGPQHPWTITCNTNMLDVQRMAEEAERPPTRSIFARLKACFSRKDWS